MGWDRVLAFAAALVLTSVALARLPFLWSGPSMYRLARAVRPSWPLGDRALLGILRATPIIIIGFGAAVVGTLLATIGRSADADQLHQIGLIILALAGFLLALAAIVGVTAAPRLLVPPSLRGYRSLEEALQRNPDRA